LKGIIKNVFVQYLASLRHIYLREGKDPVTLKRHQGKSEPMVFELTAELYPWIYYEDFEQGLVTVEGFRFASLEQNQILLQRASLLGGFRKKLKRRKDLKKIDKYLRQVNRL